METTTIRLINHDDIDEYISMCREFYSMPCCDHSVSDRHFLDAAEYVLAGNGDYAILIIQADGNIAGYTTLALSYSQEAGGKSVLIDELYIKPRYQGLGLGSKAIAYIREHYPATRYRLEITAQNTGAIRLYKKLGFVPLDYLQMVIDIDE